VGRKGLTAGICLALAVGWPAIAGSWRADQSAGGLTFEATQAGARFTGHFERFTADIAFDPAAPADCSFDVTINTASAQTGESQRDGLLKGQDFFWVERYPAASFRGSGCQPTESGFELGGELTLRGVTRPVSVRFDFEPGPDGSRLTGATTLRRLDFGVGQGEWAATQWVGGDVTVRFDLALPPDRSAAAK
jgi:polyisoprenoid-binding protein YceI